jgi:LacI family transcriptional regulator
LKRQIAGLLIAPIGFSNEHFIAAQEAGVPIVAIDRPLEHVPSDSLIVNNREASAHATAHLIGHGHREILCLADDERVYTKLERVAGYTQAMRRAKLTPRVTLAGKMTGTVAEQVEYALRSGMPPTAIFAASNIMGMEVLSYLQKKRIKIPQAMALICFDDFDAANLVSPPITVIQQPVAELGQRAAQMLLARLKGSGDKPFAEVRLATELIIRKSCGC